MNNRVLAYIRKHGAQRSFEPGDIIFHQGDTADAVYYLKSGLALTYTILPNGRQKHLTFAREDQFINLSSAILGGNSRVYAVAAIPCTVLVLGVRALHTCLTQIPQAKDELMRQMAQALDAMHDKIIDDTLYDSDLRVARFLCRCVEQKMLPEQGALPTIPFSQTVIADVVGISRSRVNKSLQRFAQEGWLSVGYGRIVLLSLQDLHDFAFRE